MGLLFGEHRRGLRGRRRTAAGWRSSPSRSTGVPQIAVDEALWMAAATSRPPAPERGLNRFLACHGLAVIYTRSQADAGSARKRQLRMGSTSRSTSASPGPSCGARSASSSVSSPASSPRPSAGSRSITGSPRVAAEPRVLDLGELERLRDELAERVAEARADPARAGPGRDRQPRAAARDAGRAGGLQVGAGQPRRPRPARLRPLALAPPPRPDRDADGLVAGQGLLRMPVSRAACGR